MSRKSVLAINFKTPTNVGILKCMTKTNDIACFSEQENCLLLLVFLLFMKITVQVSCSGELSMKNLLSPKGLMLIKCCIDFLSF